MTSDLTTKAAEIRAGLVKPLEWFSPYSDGTLSRAGTIIGTARVWTHHEANGGWYWSIENHAAGSEANEADAKKMVWATYESRILSALNLALIEQQAAELAEKAGIYDEQVTRAEKQWQAWEARATTAEAERDELLREKERLGAAHQKWWKERGGIGVACFGSGHDQERAFAKTDKEFAFAVANALSALENGPAVLADAHSKSPDISSQSERIAVLEAALAAEREACARICETQSEADPDKEDHCSDYLAGFATGGNATASYLAAAIRARSPLAPLGEE